jgi:hypothetical protein
MCISTGECVARNAKLWRAGGPRAALDRNLITQSWKEIRAGETPSRTENIFRRLHPKFIRQQQVA